jgi:hypothetical protein
MASATPSTPGRRRFDPAISVHSLHGPTEDGRFVGRVDHLKSADQVRAGDPGLSSGPDRLEQIADLQKRFWAVPADAGCRVASFLHAAGGDASDPLRKQAQQCEGADALPGTRLPNEAQCLAGAIVYDRPDLRHFDRPSQVWLAIVPAYESATQHVVAAEVGPTVPGSRRGVLCFGYSR